MRTVHAPAAPGQVAPTNVPKVLLDDLATRINAYNSDELNTFSSFFANDACGFGPGGGFITIHLSQPAWDEARGRGCSPNLAIHHSNIRIDGSGDITAVIVTYLTGTACHPTLIQIDGPWRYSETLFPEVGCCAA